MFTSKIKILSFSMVVIFLSVFVFSDLSRVKHSVAAGLSLPHPNKILRLSPAVEMPTLVGIKVDPQKPMDIDFLIDMPDNSTKKLSEEQAQRLISYFMASLAVPEKDLWVNLSPFEQDRIMADKLASTDMGKDMMRQDYILKQLASSLTEPSSEIGKEYWKSIKDNHSGFNKVWIMPEKAEIYEKDNIVVINEATLDIKTEEDYIALQKNKNLPNTNENVSNVIREHLLPKIKEDVNTGKNFAELRQIYNAVILANWFKAKYRNSFYNSYFGKNKVSGIDDVAPDVKEKVFTLYKESFDKGVYNSIRKDTQTEKKRNYFSGGAVMQGTGAVTERAEKARTRKNISVAGSTLTHKKSVARDGVLKDFETASDIGAGANDRDGLGIISFKLDRNNLDDSGISIPVLDPYKAEYALLDKLNEQDFDMSEGPGFDDGLDRPLTKMVATISQYKSSNSVEQLERLIKQGLTNLRLNSAHLNFAQMTTIINNLRNTPGGDRVAISMDAKGPEVRTSSKHNKKSDGKDEPIKLNKDDRITFKVGGKELSTKEVIHVNYDGFVKEMKVGETFSIDDGKMALIVESKTEDSLIARVTKPGIVKSSAKSINAPKSKLNVPAISPKDRLCVAYSVYMGLDFMMQSFVRNADDVNRMKEFMANPDLSQEEYKTLAADIGISVEELKKGIVENLEAGIGANMPIIAKIENQEGVRKLAEIAKLVDGVMFARGDLGIEVGLANLPMTQIRMALTCLKFNVFGLLATEVFGTMEDEKNGTQNPNRSERDALFQALIKYVDAVMFSSETAMGNHNDKVLYYANEIAQKAEEYRELVDKRMAGKQVERPYHDEFDPVGIVLNDEVKRAKRSGAEAILVSAELAKEAYKKITDKSMKKFLMVQNDREMRRFQMKSGFYTLDYQTDNNIENAAEEILSQKYGMQGKKFVYIYRNKEDGQISRKVFNNIDEAVHGGIDLSLTSSSITTAFESVSMPDFKLNEFRSAVGMDFSINSIYSVQALKQVFNTN